jgi:hypothetical protein
MPRTLPVQGANPASPSFMARAYAFYNVGKTRALAEMWSPGSYSNAEAGLIGHAGTGELRSYSLMAEQGDDTYARLMITSSPVVLVVVDPLNRYYAYGVFEYGIPMQRMDITVHFQLWKKDAHKEGWWTVVSAAYEEQSPQEPEPAVR